ncbi:MAG TPA: hypothetical protein VMC41_01595 [Candidatus Nanoarchaeia archaeon]|nr:hypothetical protein [Candidatus Nanoarchaeia archaeon]
MFGPAKKTTKDEKKPLTYREKEEAEKMAEQKKKINIFLSRRSGEQGSTGYQTSRSAFAGGEVESRSRVSLVGGVTEGEVGRAAVGKVRSQLGFAKGKYGSTKTGFAQKKDYTSASPTPGSNPPSRPLGFH